MKTHLFYRQRNADFLRDCRKAVAAPENAKMSLRAIAGRVAGSPARCYYVDPDYAARVITRLRRGKIPTTTASARKWHEIAERVDSYMARHPSVPLLHAVTEIVNNAAGSYFLSTQQALRIIYSQ